MRTSRLSCETLQCMHSLNIRCEQRSTFPHKLTAYSLFREGCEPCVYGGGAAGHLLNFQGIHFTTLNNEYVHNVRMRAYCVTGALAAGFSFFAIESLPNLCFAGPFSLRPC